MSILFKTLCRVLCLALLVPWAALHAQSAGGAHVRPSDCRPRDADSTCAAAVAGGTAPTDPITGGPVSVLYDGPLGGVPPSGYAYWGFDFVAAASGTPSPVRDDEFVNRSKVPVTIKLTFNHPTGRPCSKDCLPGVQFQTGKGWRVIGPLFTVEGDKAWVSGTFFPGQGYGWVIGLWESWNTRLTVTVPKGSPTSLEEVGLTPYPQDAIEIAAVVGTCACSDGEILPCSEGSRFSNGLLGPWFIVWDNYFRAGAFNDCPADR